MEIIFADCIKVVIMVNTKYLWINLLEYWSNGNGKKSNRTRGKYNRKVGLENIFGGGRRET